MKCINCGKEIKKKELYVYEYNGTQVQEVADQRKAI